VSTRSRHWLWLGVLSAVLNVFLIGFLAGRHALGPGGCGGRGSMRAERHGPMQQMLSQTDRARLKQQLGQVRAAREQVRDALAAEPFDPAQLEAALARLREQSAAIQLDMHKGLLESVRNATPEQRKRLASSPILKRPLGMRH
jgi:uncharacterized membrane protein